MRIPFTAAAVLLALHAAPALADRDPQSGAPLPPKQHETASPITDHFYVRASWYGPQLRTNLRADPSNAAAGITGTAVNAESDFGLPDKLNKGRVEFMFRLRDRNKVRVDYFEADRSAAARCWPMTSFSTTRPFSPASAPRARSTGSSSTSPTPTRSSATSTSRWAWGSRCTSSKWMRC